MDSRFFGARCRDFGKNMGNNAVKRRKSLTKEENQGINRFVGFLRKHYHFEEELSMNKTELVAAMAEQAELSKKDTEKALKAFIDVVTEELKKGEKIQLVGFGTFEVIERAAREGRNPLTGEKMQINASKAPKFKVGKALKDAVN